MITEHYIYHYIYIYIYLYIYIPTHTHTHTHIYIYIYIYIYTHIYRVQSLRRVKNYIFLLAPTATFPSGFSRLKFRYQQRHVPLRRKPTPVHRYVRALFIPHAVYN